MDGSSITTGKGDAFFLFLFFVADDTFDIEVLLVVKSVEEIQGWGLDQIRLLWKKKSKLPRSFDALLVFIAKYHGNKEPIIKTLCKKHLSYNKKKGHKGK